MEDEGADVVPVVAVGDAGDEEDLAVPALRADVGGSHGATLAHRSLRIDAPTRASPACLGDALVMTARPRGAAPWTAAPRSRPSGRPPRRRRRAVALQCPRRTSRCSWMAYEKPSRGDLDDAERAHDAGLDARLLADLAHHGCLERLACLDVAPGQRPGSRPRRLRAPYEQHPARRVEHDRADGHHRLRLQRPTHATILARMLGRELVRPLEDDWRETLDGVARARGWPTSSRRRAARGAGGRPLRVVQRRVARARRRDGGRGGAPRLLVRARRAEGSGGGARARRDGGARAAEARSARARRRRRARGDDVGRGARARGVRGGGDVEATWVDSDARALEVASAIARAQAKGAGRSRCDADAAPRGRAAPLDRPGAVRPRARRAGAQRARRRRRRRDARVERHAALLASWLDRHVEPDGSLVVVEPALRDRTRHLHRVRDALAASRASPSSRRACTRPRARRSRARPTGATRTSPSTCPAWLVPVARAAGLRREGLTFSYLVLRKDGRHARRRHSRVPPGVARCGSCPARCRARASARPSSAASSPSPRGRARRRGRVPCASTATSSPANAAWDARRPRRRAHRRPGARRSSAADVELVRRERHPFGRQGNALTRARTRSGTWSLVRCEVCTPSSTSGRWPRGASIPSPSREAILRVAPRRAPAPREGLAVARDARPAARARADVPPRRRPPRRERPPRLRGPRRVRSGARRADGHAHRARAAHHARASASASRRTRSSSSTRRSRRRPAYVAYGPVFETRTKANPDPVVGVEGLRAASARAAAAGVPLVAIGGITRERARDLVGLVDAVAVVGGSGARSRSGSDALREVTARARALHDMFAPGPPVLAGAAR